MEVNLEERLIDEMKIKTSMTLPTGMRNRLYLMKKRGESLYDVVGRLLELYDKVEEIKKRKIKKNLTKKSEAEKIARTKIKHESIKI